MSTKSKVLELLESNSNRYISGQQMAGELYVTRAAVWKAIKALENEGYNIEAVTNKGYRLCKEYELPELAHIYSYLKEYSDADTLSSLKIELYDCVDSTNDEIKKYADTEEEMVIIAKSQRKGRGRRGREFFSPASTGIYMSILIHPEMSAKEATSITCMMAVAVCRATMQVLGINTDIKWVNDIYYKDKKIAGILTEGSTSIEDGKLNYVIIGVGINLYEPVDGFPAEIKKTAGALLDRQNSSDDGSRLCAAIIASFFDIYVNKRERDVLTEYRNRSFLVGHFVKVTQYNDKEKKHGNEYAYVEGIDDNYRLIVKYDDNHTEYLSTGEVSVYKY